MTSPASKPRVLLWGHSFIKRLYNFLKEGEDYRASRDFNLSGKADINFKGFGGLTVSRMMAKLDDIRHLKPEVVILEIGTNDLGNERPEVVGSLIDDLVTYLNENLGVKIIAVCLVIPRRLRYSGLPDVTFNEAAFKLNHYLKGMLELYPFVFIWEHRDLLVKNDIYCFDGVHVNCRGQYYLYRSYRGAILKALKML